MFSRALAVLLTVLFFFLRYQMVKPPDLKEGMKIRIRAVLREEPVVFGQTQKFDLKGVRVQTRRFPEYHYGDYLQSSGVLSGAYGLQYPEIELLKPSGERQNVVVWLLDLRKRIEAVYNKVLPEPQASLLSGIVLGSKRSLDPDFWQALRRTGTMHVIVASGANISLVAQPVLNSLAGILPRQIALVFTFIVVWLYTFMSGFEAPVIRAAIMASVGFLAQLLGKEKNTLISLLFAASLMLFINPLLISDLGFQLSFSATLGILLFHSRFKSFFQRLPFFGADLSTTLAAQVFVLPIIYFNFGEFSWFSPLVNALVLWTIDPLMKLGGLLAVVGLFSRTLSQLIAYPAWLFLTFFVKVINLFR